MAAALNGKIALVTGGGQGIGRAVALELARRGADLLISGRTESKLVAVAAEIEALERKVVTVTGDVAVRADADRMVAAAAEHFGGLDILVNNAQAMAGQKKLLELDDENLELYFGSGARGTLYCMQAAHPVLAARGGGCIVNFGSSTGITGDPTFGAYVMTKEAIRGLSRVAAREWGRDNIRVNVVCPAALTEGAQGFRDNHPDAYAAMLKTVPLRRMGDETADIAGAVASLCGDDWSYLTGATLMLDGGRLLFP
ncbi:MAG: SDR family oxidoreductase [Actinomycetota bacterium]|nr:SDR family oxidoreductase [Actinomycetota bacterium]